jgi:RES domain-containing protein
MEVFRLSKSKFSEDLSGEGSRIFGGRWNSKGIEIIYTSETRSLALAENLVHLPLKKFTSVTHSLLAISLPDDYSIKKIFPSQLPKDWNIYPAPASLALIGDQWIKSLESLVLRVPSAAVLGEFNYLINPKHKEFKDIKWRIENFPYDERIFESAR